jgi:hypothetical protein
MHPNESWPPVITALGVRPCFRNATRAEQGYCRDLQEHTVFLFKTRGYELDLVVGLNVATIMKPNRLASKLEEMFQWKHSMGPRAFYVLLLLCRYPSKVMVRIHPLEEAGVDEPRYHD